MEVNQQGNHCECPNSNHLRERPERWNHPYRRLKALLKGCLEFPCPDCLNESSSVERELYQWWDALLVPQLHPCALVCCHLRNCLVCRGNVSTYAQDLGVACNEQTSNIHMLHMSKSGCLSSVTRSPHFPQTTSA